MWLFSPAFFHCLVTLTWIIMHTLILADNVLLKISLNGALIQVEKEDSDKSSTAEVNDLSRNACALLTNERDVVIYHVRADTSSGSYDEVYIKIRVFFFFFLESFRGQSYTTWI